MTHTGFSAEANIFDSKLAHCALERERLEDDLWHRQSGMDIISPEVAEQCCCPQLLSWAKWCEQ